MLQSATTAQRKNEVWMRERHRYDVLTCVYRCTNGDCGESLACTSVAEEMRLPRDEVFGILHDLEFLGYLSFVGSGPRVRITPRAVAYLLIGSDRRRSVRDQAPAVERKPAQALAPTPAPS